MEQEEKNLIEMKWKEIFWLGANAYLYSPDQVIMSLLLVMFIWKK